MYNLDKYAYGIKSSFDSKSPNDTIKLGIVTVVGKVTVNNEDSLSRNKDVNFNNDEHVIRCRIIGSDYDNTIPDEELPNCHPLMPKHFNLTPKVGEVVLIFSTNSDDKFSDRFYIGPIISSLTNLKLDTINGTALSHLGVGKTNPKGEISKIVTARGVYEDTQNVVITGRGNTDIIQRDEEILLRSGKFVTNQPSVFNGKNPGYIQLKFNHSHTDLNNNTKSVSVTNIVSDKINLLTYNGSKSLSNLTNVNKDNVAEYITDDELDNLLNESHPLVFGDLLVDYLKLLKRAMINHVHNGNGNKPTDRTDGNGLPLDEFIKKSEELELRMLSKNIKTN